MSFFPKVPNKIKVVLPLIRPILILAYLGYFHENYISDGKIYSGVELTSWTLSKVENMALKSKVGRRRKYFEVQRVCIEKKFRSHEWASKKFPPSRHLSTTSITLSHVLKPALCIHSFYLKHVYKTGNVGYAIKHRKEWTTHVLPDILNKPVYLVLLHKGFSLVTCERHVVL